MRRTALLAPLAALALVATPLTASALPLQYSERPLTLTEGSIEIDAYLSYFQFSLNLGEFGTAEADPIISLIAGVNYGITDDFEVGVLALPLVLSPDTDYGNPQLHATYRFLRSAVELGVSAYLTIPVQDNTDLGLSVGLPALFGLTNTTKIVSGLYLNFVFADELGKGLSIPFEFAVNFNPNLFLFINSGINLPDFDPDFLNLPLGVGVGYTLPASADAPLADLYLGFTFPAFLNASGDAINADIYEFRLGAKIHMN